MGRVPEGKTPTIGYLHPHHRAMVRSMVAGGLRPSELASQFGMSNAQITKIIHSPLFKAELERLEGSAELVAVDASLDLQALKGRATEVLASDLYDPGVNRGLRNKTALEILDRTGHGKKGDGGGTQKHLHVHAHAEVKKMDRKEIFDDVMDLLDEEDEG